MTDKLNELLLTVQKPGRYIGGEWNAIKKEWTPDRVKVCLAFPDLYEVGMSYLGIKILYGILNNRDDCLCERVFAPWPDFEKVLRENKIPLYGLESRNPLKKFDIIGFSLAYELGYTNVLNILDLGGIPVRSAERGPDDPLIIAGGPSCFNPEPMAEFIDAFVIGDGEEVIGEIVERYKVTRSQGHTVARSQMLGEMAKIEGIYVPSFYRVRYDAQGLVENFCPVENGAPKYIKKRIVRDLDKAYYPEKQIVPNIQVVHDRMAIEIMRGCKHACRFCQASATYAPARERSKNTIMRLARGCYPATGYDEISLLSLSSGDHSEIMGLLNELNCEFAGKAVSVSVPSLRIEDRIADLPALISRVKKSGLTFAPEAGSARLRKICGKNIDIEKLFRTCEESFKSGWRHVKLYFMIGLPGEEEADILDIAVIVRRISEIKKKVDGRAARVNVSVNPFVPKPHTNFEREPMDSIDVLRGKIELLRKAARSNMIELDFHDLHTSYIEAVFSRGDRRLAKAIYGAWKGGARFDAWQEAFDFDKWSSAIKESGLDPWYYTNRKMDKDAMLPWGFIHT